MLNVNKIIVFNILFAMQFCFPLESIHAQEDEIIYAPQLAITQEDVEQALNMISKSYVKLKANWDSKYSTVGVEYFGANKYISTLGDINFDYHGDIYHMETNIDFAILGDSRYMAVQLSGSYLYGKDIPLDNGNPNLFLGISLNHPIIKIMYQKQYNNHYDRFFYDIDLLLFSINKIYVVGVYHKLDYTYQNKYIKSTQGFSINVLNHTLNIEHKYYDLEFKNKSNQFSLIYEIVL